MVIYPLIMRTFDILPISESPVKLIFILPARCGILRLKFPNVTERSMGRIPESAAMRT
jgi:hypothetical protein